MSYFGLTTSEALYAWSMNASMFNEPPNGTVPNGETVIAQALARAEATVKANLPARVLELFTKIEGEIVVQDADSSQSTATLAMSASTTSQIILWQFARGTFYANELYKGSGYRITAFTVAADKRTITFTTALNVGDIVVATYPVGLGNNCPSLKSVLLDVAALELLAPRYPGMRESFQARYDAAMTYLSAVRDGNAMLPELSSVRLVRDALPERGTVTISSWRLPQ